ncbi:hypothetical protein ACIQPR_48600 [Streptomyces sp. NPDC091280]|uniref:hypothetical protein n=1 Tax=Streptomyces sp. NPDC091280 TaxID=3365984 RepID=UPI00381C08DC
MILLTGYWGEGANLVIESSQEFPDSMSKTELDEHADKKLADRQNGWDCSFLVDNYSRACRGGGIRDLRPGGRRRQPEADRQRLGRSSRRLEILLG